MIRKRGVEPRLVPDGIVSMHPDSTLVKLIGNAHGWMERSRSGQVTSIRSLARDGGLDHHHLARALSLAFLAPDIVEAILEGREPASLTAGGLKRLSSLPIRWRTSAMRLASRSPVLSRAAGRICRRAPPAGVSIVQLGQ